MSAEPEADTSLSALVPVDTPVPSPTAIARVSKLDDSKWGLSFQSLRGKACERECCLEVQLDWRDPSLAAVPPTVLCMMKTIEHIQSYPWWEDAIRNEPSIVSKPYMVLRVPPIMVAMAFDWDLTCAHPFLKRLCHQLKNDIVCGKGSGSEDDVDLILSLPSTTWTKGSTLEPIPICPVLIGSVTHQDTTNRLKKWLGDYFTCLEENGFAYPDYDWAVPYFVLSGPCWTIGVAVKGASSLHLHEENLCSIDWFEGVSRITLILGHIIGSTAEHCRVWYREHGQIRQLFEQG